MTVTLLFAAIGVCPADKPNVFQEGAACCDGEFGSGVSTPISIGSDDCFTDGTGGFDAIQVNCPEVGGICKSYGREVLNIE